MSAHGCERRVPVSARSAHTSASVLAPPPICAVTRTLGGAVLLDGRSLRNEIVGRLRAEFVAAGSPPVCLATVVVGGDASGLANVAAKHQQAAVTGMLSRNVVLASTASQADVEDAVGALVDDPSVHGVFVQLPLPPSIDRHLVLDLIVPDKDIDGLGDRSLGRLVAGRDGHAPAAPLGVVRLLERYGVATAGRRAVVVGRSPTVGLPLSLLLGRSGTDATVVVAHRHTPDLAETCRQADIVIAAAGCARLIGVQHVRPGATVVDLGVTRTATGIVGDVDFDAVQAVAGAITPMPGGTGPMTIACLLQNTLAAARLQGAFP